MTAASTAPVPAATSAPKAAPLPKEKKEKPTKKEKGAAPPPPKPDGPPPAKVVPPKLQEATLPPPKQEAAPPPPLPPKAVVTEEKAPVAPPKKKAPKKEKQPKQDKANTPPAKQNGAPAPIAPSVPASAVFAGGTDSFFSGGPVGPGLLVGGGDVDSFNKTAYLPPPTIASILPPPSTAPVAPPPKATSPPKQPKAPKIASNPIVAALNEDKAEGTTLFKGGKFVEASTLFTDLLKKCERMPKEVRAYMVPRLYANVAACHLEVGETTKCIDECSKALDEIGDVAEERALAFKVRLRRADARYRLGMKEEARGDLVVLKKTAAGKAEKVALEILEKLIDAEVVLD